MYVHLVQLLSVDNTLRNKVLSTLLVVEQILQVNLLARDQRHRSSFDELAVVLKVVLRRHQAAQLLPNNKVLVGDVLITSFLAKFA